MDAEYPAPTCKKTMCSVYIPVKKCNILTHLDMLLKSSLNLLDDNQPIELILHVQPHYSLLCCKSENLNRNVKIWVI